MPFYAHLADLISNVLIRFIRYHNWSNWYTLIVSGICIRQYMTFIITFSQNRVVVILKSTMEMGFYSFWGTWQKYLYLISEVWRLRQSPKSSIFSPIMTPRILYIIIRNPVNYILWRGILLQNNPDGRASGRGKLGYSVFPLIFFAYITHTISLREKCFKKSWRPKKVQSNVIMP